MDVKNIVERRDGDVVSVRPDSPISHAARTLNENRIGAVIVTDDNGSMAGILSERDVSRGVSEHGTALSEKPVSELMTNNVITCRLEDSMNDVLSLMAANGIRHVPVMEKDSIVGMVSMRDAITLWLDTVKELNSLKEEVELFRKQLGASA